MAQGCSLCIAKPKAIPVGLDPFELLRFMTKVRRHRGCWLWMGCTDAAGYGVFSWRNRAFWAHRVSYATLVAPLEAGLHINHRCRRRRCVNPTHLEPMTVSENCRDGARARWAKARES